MTSRDATAIIGSMFAEVLSPSGELERRARAHAALGDATRLRIVDLLAFTDLTPSQVAAELGIGSNLLAHHLRILQEAGLVERLRSEGDARRRYLRLVPTAYAGIAAVGGTLRVHRVLFVCTGNSARSQLAAGMWNAVSDVGALSAGTHPEDAVHPEAVRAGREAGIDLRDARPRAVSGLDPAPDLWITVCDRAHEELNPPSDTTVLHWWIPDPRPVGTPEAFDDTVRRLRSRIDTLRPHVASAARRRAPSADAHGRRRSRRTKEAP
jgi:protein-tyrosine-phosphatase/DNA-binding transcriptional ArsR family regulator